MSGSRPRVAIVGAGVAGLGIGWRLAAAGCAVDIFDQGAPGRGASHAAAGMLAACAEVEPGEEALLALTRHSQRLWPGFAAELEAVSGIDVELRTEGTLIVALTGDDLARLRIQFAHQQELGLPTEWLAAAEVRRREPHLHAGLAGAIFCPEDHQVDNRRLVAALLEAVARAGGRVHAHSPVTALVVEDGRVAGVRLGAHLHRAERVVLAAGAWSRGIPGLPAAARPPVRPVKGQMLALRMDPAAPLLRHVLWAGGTYLVPRRDGRLIVGATVEERGFDDRPTAGGLLALLDGAWRALPAVEDLAVDEIWVGFRPGSRDDAPILGPGPVEGLVLATGHHRNGILLALVTADAVSRFVLTGVIDDIIRPFGLDRFAPAARPGP